ncbi:MAG: D-2-hydroxyacid dehydrogenase [Dehalococcoidales bacterium]|nr:D-2-hydroxyacid dehydrogenase [Dehalococcoidales bacterium]
MKTLKVLVIMPPFGGTVPAADKGILDMIRAVSPGIEVHDASALAFAELAGDHSAKSELDRLLARTEVIYGLVLPQGLVSRAPHLKWVQMMSAGTDRLRGTDIWQSHIAITSASGIHATPIGEFVLGFMLMFAKGMPRCLAMKREHTWQRYSPTVLRGKTVGIIGLGHIRREVARLSKAFGMRVIATRRSAVSEGRTRYVDRLLPSAKLPELLGEADFVVICTPHTPETHHLIGEKELRMMKSTAHIINIARGGIIDETALVRALNEKWIAGAGLDVTEKEPLPPDSPLWELDNVIISPHVSGGMEDYTVKATALFCENLRRYLAGKRLKNLVDRKRGY